MTKLRTGDPWMPAPAYGRTLTGVGVNLLVPSIDSILEFQTEVLGATAVYHDPDIAVFGHEDAQWMFHADHTYDAHPWHATLTGGHLRGIGIEIRVHHCDPDAAEARALELGYHILQGVADKPHGLREAFLVDAVGYVWVPDVPVVSK